MVTGNPTRSGTGFGAKESVSNELGIGTVAPATLQGARVEITATAKDVTLSGARLTGTESVTLTAQEGAVNMNVVSTTTEISQTRGQNDLAYQRSKDTGVSSETASYSQIDTPKLTVNTPRVNVQVGQNTLVAGSGSQTVQVPLQQVADVLAQQSTKPGMSWMQQIQQDQQLNKLQVNWQGVPLEQRQWAESQSGLTPTGAAIVTIVASVLTYGAATEVGMAASTATTTATGSAVAGTVVQGAVVAGLTTLAGQVSVSLINNNGDIGAVLKELGSSRNIKQLVAAMATGGALQGLDLMPQPLPTGADLQDVMNLLSTNLKAAAVKAVISTAVYGGSFEDQLKTGLLNAVIDTGAAKSASLIGDAQLDSFTNKVAHALSACAAGTAKVRTSDGCSAGALGSVAGEITSEYLGFDENGNPLPQGTQLAGLIGATAAALAGLNAEQIELARDLATITAENNGAQHYVQRALKKLGETLQALEVKPLVQSQQAIREYLDSAAARGGLTEPEIAVLAGLYVANEVLFPTNLLDFIGGKAVAKAGTLLKAGVKSEEAATLAAKELAKEQRYVPSPKHEPGGWGTTMNLSDEVAESVLKESQQIGRQRYGFREGKIYEFQFDNAGGWHGYPIPGNEAPVSYLRSLKNEGIISTAEYNNLIKGGR